MSNIVIICVGKLDKIYWKNAALEYLKRLKHQVSIVIHSVSEVSSNIVNNNIKDESMKIKKWLNRYSTYQHYLLDLTGNLVSSEEIAKIIIKNQSFYQGKLLFIIGGSNGVSLELKTDVNIQKIALAKITFPHQLCQVILLEQLYRAYQIINNKPYHK